MRLNPAAVRFDLELRFDDGTERDVALWLVCGSLVELPVAVAAVVPDLPAATAGDDEVVEEVVAAVQLVAAEHGISVMENPYRQHLLITGRPEKLSRRFEDPVVQRAVALAHRQGLGTYAQLAEQFGLEPLTLLTTAITHGERLLYKEAAGRPAPGAPPLSVAVAPVAEGPSEPQRKKFKKFSERNDAQDLIDFVRKFVAFAGLELGELGETWGLTVCPSADTVVRLNVGPREVLAVWRDGRGHAFGIDAGHLGDLPEGLQRRSGFPRVADSYALTFRFGSTEGQLFELDGFAPESKAFCDHHLRRIVPNFHNPLTTPLLLGAELLGGGGGSVLPTVEKYRERYGSRPETFEAYVEVFDSVPGASDFPGGWTAFSRAASAEPAMEPELVALAEDFMRQGGFTSTEKEPGKGRRWFKDLSLPPSS